MEDLYSCNDCPVCGGLMIVYDYHYGDYESPRCINEQCGDGSIGKECKVCWQKVDYLTDEYCSNHRNSCGISYCKNRIETYSNYCSEHRNTCEWCSSRIPENTKTCSLHSKVCSNPSCQKRISANKYACDDHRDYYCQVSSCSVRISRSESYCSQHAKSCQNCSTRIPSYQSYCSYHQQQANEQNNLKSLVRQKTSLSNPQEVVRFTTWWNNNLATVVNGNYSYTVWLLVYEPAIKNMSEVLEKFEISSDYSLDSSKNRARELRIQLDGESPILHVHPKANNYVSFSGLITNPYVIKRDVPCQTERFLWNVSSSAPVNAEFYLKPLDIVWVKKSHKNWGIGYHHVGVYIGKKNDENWMCHLDGDNRGAELITWEKFLKNGTCEKLIRFHPIIPFKRYQKITKNIAWATDGTPYRQGNYDLWNRNCEHFANMIVYGINYSKQVYDEVSWGNNDKGSTIELANEMSEVDNKLGWITNECSREIEARIEVPSKENCRIM